MQNVIENENENDSTSEGENESNSAEEENQELQMTEAPPSSSVSQPFEDFHDESFDGDDDDDDDVDDDDSGGDDDDDTNNNDGDALLEEATSTSTSLPLPLYQTNIPRVTCALLASITTGGVSYAFGLYGAALKKNLHLTQGQLETISSATFCAGLFSWLPGMFVDRFGTRAGITTGGITGSITLLLYWAVAKQYIPISEVTLVVVVLSMLSMAIFLSCALITGAVFKIISCSCEPHTKGSAVGVAKGYVGLGSGAYACIFQSIRTPATSDLDFLPMCAFFFIVAATVPSFLNLPTKIEEQNKMPDVLTPLHFRILYGSLLFLAVLIIGSSLEELFKENEENQSTQNEAKPNHILTASIIVAWIAPIIAQVYLPQARQPATGAALEITSSSRQLEEHNLLIEDEEDRREKGGLLDTAKQHLMEENRGELHATAPDLLLQSPRAPVERQDSAFDGQKNLFEMLGTFPAWLMLWTTTIIVGGGIVETNNLGQMVEALRFPPIVTSASLSLFSVAQSGGRVATGALSDWALTANTKRCCINLGVPRPFFLLVGSFVGVLAHAILAVSTKEVSFVIGIALSGLAFGSAWPLMVLIAGEIYGTAHVGANYMFYDGFTSAAGAFLLSKVVAQQVYESHIDPHFSEGDNGLTCYGLKCFQMTHVIIAFLSLTCMGTSLILQYTTRERYNRI